MVDAYDCVHPYRSSPIATDKTQQPSFVERLARSHRQYEVAGGFLFAVAAAAQLLFTLWLGGSRFSQSGAGLALYRSLNVPAYALICTSLAGYYIQHKSRLGRVQRTAYPLLLISVVGLPGVVLVTAVTGWLRGATLGGMLASVHEAALAVAILSLFSGSVLRGVSSMVRSGALPLQSVLLIVSPPAIAVL